MATFITIAENFKFGSYVGPLECNFEYLREVFGTDEDRQAAALVTQGAGSLSAANPIRVKAKAALRMKATDAFVAWCALNGASRDQGQQAGQLPDWAAIRKAMLNASRFMALQDMAAPPSKAKAKAQV